MKCSPAKTGNTCPSVPDDPKSPTLQSNIKVGKALSWLPPGNRLLFFYFNVHNKGPMDYKQQGQTLDDPGRWHPSPYQDFGNFNFGVTGAAANIPLQVLLRGAGWAQQHAKTSNPSFGHWYDWNPPYGDDPADQAMIRSGYAAYKNGCY